ncbi:MAG: hypothetical protein V4773_29970, partial [Verrucomicrobiota bacterium]
MKPKYVVSMVVAAAALFALGFVVGESRLNPGLSGSSASRNPSTTSRTDHMGGAAPGMEPASVGGAARGATVGAGDGRTGARADSWSSPAAKAAADSQARVDLFPDSETLGSQEFQKILGEQVKAKVAARYAEYFHRANLPGDKVAVVQQLLLERQTAYVDAAQAAREKGLADSEVADFAGQYARQAQKDVMMKLKAALGKDGYDQLLYFERTQPEREAVLQLARRLSYGEAPLTGQHVQQLVDILAADTNARRAKNSAGTAASSTAGTEKLSRHATSLLGSY